MIANNPGLAYANQLGGTTLIIFGCLFIAAVVTAIAYVRMSSEEFKEAFYDKVTAYFIWVMVVVFLVTLLLAYIYYKTGYRPSARMFLFLLLLCLAAPVVSILALGLSFSTAAISLIASYVAISFLQIIGTFSVLLLTNWMVTQIALSQRQRRIT
jgi:hypothetical protein